MLIARKEHEGTKVVPVRLPLSVIAMVDAYAKYVNGDRNYVVTEALKIVFAQDKEFVKWQKQGGMEQTQLDGETMPSGVSRPRVANGPSA